MPGTTQSAPPRVIVIPRQLEGFFYERLQARFAGRDDVRVVVDRMSAPYLNGAVIDFVDSIEKQGFTIDNPNATGSCACGDSFH